MITFSSGIILNEKTITKSFGEANTLSYIYTVNKDKNMKGKDINGEENQLLLSFLISIPFLIVLYLIKCVIDSFKKSKKTSSR